MSRPPAPPSPTARRVLDDARGTRAMTWVMAVMTFLTILAGALGLATWRAGDTLDRQLAGRLTVQLLGADDARVARTVDTLRQVPGISAAQAVPRAELAELLRPWLGDAGLDADLPIPAMIDVDLASSDADAAEVAVGRIRALAPDARVDRNAAWLAPVRGFVDALGWVAIGLVLLMASATAAVVLLAARAGLDTHRDTIDVLHMLGSTDVQVSRLFQRRIALDTLIGGGIGAALAALGIMLIGREVTALESAVTSGLALSAGDWILLALLPLLFAGLAAGVARFAVLRALGRVL